MSTMNDIAKLAGVSQGTVSNVLNNRGNVSAKKIKLVQEAARQVGYIMNAPAHQLRSSSSLSRNIGVILPNIIEEKYALFYSSLQEFWHIRNYQVSLWITNDTPHYEKQAIAVATAARVSGILTVTCLPDSADSYKTILQYGGQVVYVERESLNTYPYIGYDYHQAGKDMAEHILKMGFHSAALILGLNFFSCESQFESGFRDFLRENRARDFLCQTHNTYLFAVFQSAFRLYENGAYPDCIIVSGKSFYDRTLQALSTVSSKTPPPIFTITADNLKARCDASCFCMDYSILSHQASSLLFSCLSNGEKIPERTVLDASGFVCPKPIPYITPKKIPLNVLMVQGQPASAIMQMTPRFSEATHLEINYVSLPLGELTSVLSQMNGNHFFDVIRTNITTTPRFPEGVLRPISNDTFHQLTQTMYPEVVKGFSYCHGQTVAIPFDIGTYFYAYRKDLFTDPIIMRTYLEKYSEELDLPNDFSKLNRIASYFCQKENPDSPVPFGTTGPSNDMALIFTHFLFIYRNLGGHLKAPDGTFMFNRDIAYQAILLQKELMPFSLSLESSRRDSNVTNFIQEKTALEIVSTSYASRLLDLRHRSISGVLGFSPLPANTGTFGGGSLAIPVGCKEPEAAESYIRWACGYDQAYLFTLLGGTTPHKPIYKEHDILELYPWFSLMDRSIETSYPLSELDIFDRYQLERFMGFTLSNIYCGVIPLDHCLDVLEQGMASYLLDK